jgi:cytochrome c oxidase subunit I
VADDGRPQEDRADVHRYALIFLVIAGVEALLMRIQLAVPNNHFVSPQVFNRLFTMHGTTMVFFVAMPILFGFGNYLVPLMIGARDMAFPRLNAFSFWISAFAGLLLYFSYFAGKRPVRGGIRAGCGLVCVCAADGKGVFARPQHGLLDAGRFLSGIGTIGTALNIVTTIICMRCKGMKMSRMPLLVWLYLVMSSCLVFVTISPLTAAQIMLTLDRYLGSHFFDTQAGGSAVLWMHFFWIFGHPEVYVLVLPAFAFINEIVPVFSRKAIFGYPAMVAASVGIGFISLSVWAHHMFTVGMGAAANTFFVFATMVISVPTGIKIFNWLATIWGGKVIFATPMLFCVGFLFQFLIAGLTGIMLVRGALRLAAGNSYFVVAHFHYVLVGGICLPCLRPSTTGIRRSRADDERDAGQVALLALRDRLPSHLRLHACPGLLGMPRRIYTYEAGRGWEVLEHDRRHRRHLPGRPAFYVFVYNLVWSYFKGKEAGHDPWDAWTLEWSTTSPPPTITLLYCPR